MSDYRVMAIDPGPEKSGGVLLQADLKPVWHGWILTTEMLTAIWEMDPGWDLVIEDISFQHRPTGRLIHDTNKAIGRYQQEYERGLSRKTHLLFSSDVKLCLCRDSFATRGALTLATYEHYGGSRQLAVGTKKQPGPLHGMNKHALAAVAIGITYMETMR